MRNPVTVQNLEMQELYNTSNRAERISFARKKREEGYTVHDIALPLHSSRLFCLFEIFTEYSVESSLKMA